MDADQPQPLADADRQDLRLAVVLNGGVSLAVWISGVVVELHRLVQASRRTTDRAADPYAGLLDVLQARARVDVIAGTSAGGLNGGFLSLGLVHGCDLAGMRDLWRDQGSLEVLLRDPRRSDSPSLLRGSYFHDALQNAYADIAARDTGSAAADDEPVDLYLTGTLWEGRQSPFTDSLGRAIVEVDHDATFRFSSDAECVEGAPQLTNGAAAGDLRNAAGVAPQLAVASRCTSSFPGAFEPWFVEVGDAFGGRWASSAGLANFARSQFVVDGGVLLNKPIRPALDAVYRQAASQQVRRLMAYVVPDPGEAPAPAAVPDRPRDGGQPAPQAVPGAPEVLLGVLTRLRSTDSVAAELAEITRRNESSRFRRRVRERVAAALARGDDALVEAAYPAYRDVRADTAATDIASLLARTSGHGWSSQELAAVLRGIARSTGLPFVPPSDLAGALRAEPHNWQWGQSEVGRLGDLAIDVLRRAVALAPLGSDARVTIVAARSRVHTTLAEIRRDTAALESSWVRTGSRLPRRSGGGAASPGQIAALRAALEAELTAWEGDDVGAARARLHNRSLQLARWLFEAAGAVAAVARQDPAGGDDPDRAALRALSDALAGDSPELVLQRMLRLQVLFVAFAGASTQVEQEVDLVQVSSATPELLTGIQENHFGAFYRPSWRVNDWLRGRLDGSAQLVTMLLLPDRLRQLGLTSAQAYEQLRQVAVGTDPALAAAWDADAVRLREELSCLDVDGPLPRTFPLVALRIAERVHAQLLPDELGALADAIEAEPDPLAASRAWATATHAVLAGTPTVPALAERLAASRVVGEQRIRTEALATTDTFARTASHGAAALASLISATKAPALVRGTLSAVRGYAVLVWMLVSSLTTRSNVSVNLVSLVLGVGGALLALALVVPGIPVGVTLLGAGLVLSAATATALTDRERWGRLGLRIGLVALVVLIVLAVDWLWLGREKLGQSLRTGLGGALVVVAVVLAGWWIARARPARPGAAPQAVAAVPVQPQVIDLTESRTPSRRR